MRRVGRVVPDRALGFVNTPDYRSQDINYDARGFRIAVCADALNSKAVDAVINHMKCVITTMRRALGRSEWGHAIKSASAQI